VQKLTLTIPSRYFDHSTILTCSLGQCAAIARMMDVPFIGCCSHKLNLQVDRMVKNHPNLQTVISDIHETMSSCRNGLKTSAMLRTLEPLRPIVENATRWSGKHAMLARFNKIRESLITVADSDGVRPAVDRSELFGFRARKYELMLDEINHVTLELQRHGITFSECRSALDLLIGSVQSEGNNIDSPLYDCRLLTDGIGDTGKLVINPLFESGVVKIKRNEIEKLTDEERYECRGRNNINKSVINGSKIARSKRHRICKGCAYVNSDIILGSVAEV